MITREKKEKIKTFCVVLLFMCSVMLSIWTVVLAYEKHKIVKQYESEYIKKLEMIYKLGSADSLNEIDTKGLREEDIILKQSLDIAKNTRFLIENEEHEFRVFGFFNEGVTKDMISLSIEKGFLTIHVSQKQQEEIIRSELMENFATITILKRRILIPPYTDITKADARYRDNVLRVIIPKIQKPASKDGRKALNL